MVWYGTTADCELTGATYHNVTTESLLLTACEKSRAGVLRREAPSLTRVKNLKRKGGSCHISPHPIDYYGMVPLFLLLDDHEASDISLATMDADSVCADTETAIFIS